MTEALQKKEKIEAELKSLLGEWLTLMYTEELLSRAQAIYESGRQPEIMKMANEFLKDMTMGKYALHISDNGKDIYIEDSMHGVKTEKIWSSGTGDQVYLAIRLAMALSFGEQIEPLPIVLDDIFVRFDEKRQRETLRFLMELGKNSRFSSSPATKEPCTSQKKWAMKRNRRNSSTCPPGRLSRWGVEGGKRF